MNRRDFLGAHSARAARARRSASRAERAGTGGARASGSSNVTAAAGMQFQHNSGAYGGKLLPETLGPGCAFLDYDADGWPDILLVNGMDWPGPQAPALDARGSIATTATARSPT